MATTNKKIVTLNSLKNITDDIYSKMKHLGNKDALRKAIKITNENYNAITKEAARSDRSQEFIPKEDKDIFVAYPQYIKHCHSFHIDDEDFYDRIKNDSKFPWKAIDFSYISDGRYFFSALNIPEVTEIPELINTNYLHTLESFYESQEKIKEVPPFDNLKKCNNLNCMFRNCQELESIPDFPSLEMEFTCAQMFEYCSKLEKAPAFPDSTYITDAEQMFNFCQKLNNVPEYNLKYCTNVRSMFNECTSLPEEFPWEIDLSFVQSVEDLNGMFSQSSISKVTFKNMCCVFDHSSEYCILDPKQTISDIIGPNAKFKKIEVTVENFVPIYGKGGN